MKTTLKIRTDRGIRHHEWVDEDGYLHNNSGPAITQFRAGSGRKRLEEWRIHGKRQRDDGPALIQYDIDEFAYNQEWYQGGKLHREDGPASIYEWKGEREMLWFLEGAKLDINEFAKYIGLSMEDRITIKLAFG